MEVEEVDSAYMSVEIWKNKEDYSYATPKPIESVKSFVVDSMGEKKYIYQFPVDFEHHLEDDLFKRPDTYDGYRLPYGDGIYGGRLAYKVNGGHFDDYHTEWRYDGQDMIWVPQFFNTQQHTIISGNPSSSIHSVYNNMLREDLTGGMSPRENYEELVALNPEVKDIITKEKFSDFFEKFLNSIIYDGKIISIPEEFKDIVLYGGDFTLYESLELTAEEILSNHPFLLVNKLQGSFDNTNSWIVTSPEPLSTIEFEIRMMNDMAS